MDNHMLLYEASVEDLIDELLRRETVDFVAVVRMFEDDNRNKAQWHHVMSSNHLDDDHQAIVLLEVGKHILVEGVFNPDSEEEEEEEIENGEYED